MSQREGERKTKRKRGRNRNTNEIHLRMCVSEYNRGKTENSETMERGEHRKKSCV
jgi:hypothetical protein